MYFRLMAVLLDLPVTPTSESVYISLIVLLSPEHVGGIPLPETIQDLQSELQMFPVSRPPFWFPVEHGWIIAQCDIVSSSDDFNVLEK